MGRAVRKLPRSNESKPKEVDASLSKDKEAQMLKSPRRNARPVSPDCEDEEGEVTETSQDGANTRRGENAPPLQDALNNNDASRGCVSPLKFAKTPDRSKLFHQAVLNSPLPDLRSPYAASPVPLFQSPCKLGLSPLPSCFRSPAPASSPWPFADTGSLGSLGLGTPFRDLGSIFHLMSPQNSKQVNAMSETNTAGDWTQPPKAPGDTSKSSSTQLDTKSCNTTDSKPALGTIAGDTEGYKSFLISPSPSLGGVRPPRSEEPKPFTRSAKRVLDYNKAENPLSQMSSFYSTSRTCPDMDMNKVFSNTLSTHEGLGEVLDMCFQKVPAAAAVTPVRDLKDAARNTLKAPEVMVPKTEPEVSRPIEVPQPLPLPVPMDIHVGAPITSMPALAVEQFVPQQTVFKLEEPPSQPVFLKSPPVKSPRWPPRSTQNKLYRAGSGERGTQSRFRQANADQYTPGTKMPETPSDSRKSEQVPIVSVHSNKMCHCKKSQCLKLYCECFAAGLYCQNCSCLNCKNQPEHADLVVQKREQIRQRDPDAFSTKIMADTNNSARHKRGCNCRRSHCLKKYCECFQAGVKCADLCKCVDCQNLEDFGSSAAASKRTESSRGWHIAHETNPAGLPATPQISTARSGEGTPQTPSHQSSVTSAGLSTHPNVRRSLHMPPPSLPPSSGSIASGVSMSVNQGFPGSGYASQPPTPHSTLSTSSVTPVAMRHPNMLTSPPQGPLFAGSSPLLRTSSIPTSNAPPYSMSQRFSSPHAPLSFPPPSMLPSPLPFTSAGLPPSPALTPMGTGSVARALSPSPRLDLAPATCIDSRAGDLDDVAAMEGRLAVHSRVLPPSDVGLGLKRSLSMQLMQDTPLKEKPIPSLLPQHGSTPNLQLYKPDPQASQLQSQSSLGHTPRHRAASPHADMPAGSLLSPNSYQDHGPGLRRVLNHSPADMPPTPLLQTRSLPLYHTHDHGPSPHLTPQHSLPPAHSTHPTCLAPSSLTSVFAQSYVQAQHPLSQLTSMNGMRSSESPPSPDHARVLCKADPDNGAADNPSTAPAAQPASKLMRVASIQYQGTPGLLPLVSQHSVSATSDAEGQPPAVNIKSESPRGVLKEVSTDGGEHRSHSVAPVFAPYGASAAHQGEAVPPLVSSSSLPHAQLVPPATQSPAPAAPLPAPEVSMDKAISLNPGEAASQQQHVGFLVTIAGSQYFVPATSSGQPNPASGVTIEPVMQAAPGTAHTVPLAATSLCSRPPTPKPTTSSSSDLRMSTPSFGATANSQIPDAAVGALPSNEGMPPVGTIAPHDGMPPQAMSQQAALAQAVALAAQQGSIPSSPSFPPHQRASSPTLHAPGSQHMGFHTAQAPSPSLHSRSEFDSQPLLHNRSEFNTQPSLPLTPSTSAGMTVGMPGGQHTQMAAQFEFGAPGRQSVSLEMGARHDNASMAHAGSFNNGIMHGMHDTGRQGTLQGAAMESVGGDKMAGMQTGVMQYEPQGSGPMHGGMSGQVMLMMQDGGSGGEISVSQSRSARTTPVKRSRELSFAEAAENVTPVKAGRSLLGPDTPCESVKSLEQANSAQHTSSGGPMSQQSCDLSKSSAAKGLFLAPYDTQMQDVHDVIFSQGAVDGMRRSEAMQSGVRMSTADEFGWMNPSGAPVPDMSWAQDHQSGMQRNSPLAMLPHHLSAVSLVPAQPGGSQS